MKKSKVIAGITALFAASAILASCGGGSSQSSSSEEDFDSNGSKVPGTRKDFDIATDAEAAEYDIKKQSAETINKVLNGRTKKAGASYTYKGAVDTLPTSWNVHTYQSNSSTTILDYTEDSFYTFDYNDTLDGYKIVLGMAAEAPKDVTADYVGKYGIAAGEAHKAYKIKLRQDLKFDNGDAIKAADFVESMKQLLNPMAGNYRADEAWSGNFKIYGAEQYAKGDGKYHTGAMVSENYGEDEYVDPKNFVAEADGHFTYEGQDVLVCLEDGGNWGSNPISVYSYYGYLGDFYIDETTGKTPIYDAEYNLVAYWDSVNDVYTDAEGNAATGALHPSLNNGFVHVIGGKTLGFAPAAAIANMYADADEAGWVKLNATTLAEVQNAIAMLHDYESAEAYAADAGDYAYQEWEELGFYGKQWDAVDFSTVGCFADPADPYSVIYVGQKALQGFYLYYSFCSSQYLVHTGTYAANATESQGVYSSTYGTSVDSYVGFGPYKLTSYIDGNSCAFEKNPYWYGYNDAENAQLYWATNIEYKAISSAADRLSAFNKGELDSYGLQAADMADYANSEYKYMTDGDSTWFVAINPDEDGLVAAEQNADPITANNEVDKQILTILEFRQALSFSIDRAEYELTLDPTGGVAKALYSSLIVSDPDNGTAYRTTTEAKDAILKFWGLYDEVRECGFPEGTYATRDEAIATITGYAPDAAKVLFDAAYDEAVEKGFISADAIASGNWEVQIMIGQPGSGSSAYYTNGYEYLKTAWTKAVQGTKLEGHLTFKQSQPLGSTSFSSYLKNNTVDILFGVGWTGSTLNPYGLMEAYVKPSYQYDPGWDTSATDCDIELTDNNGVTYTLRASVYDWGYTFLGGDTIYARVVGADGKLTGEYVKISGGTETNATVRLKVLAAIEEAVLCQYDMIPVGTDCSANLKGMKIEYGKDEYVFGVGRGGYKYMTFNYTDAEWATFVQGQGGTLNYK